MRRVFATVCVMAIMLILTQCAWLWNNTPDPKLKEQHDAYVSVNDYHATKQLVLVEYYRLFSNDFKNDLFDVVPTSDDIADFAEMLSFLYKKEEAMLQAISTLRSSDGISANNYLLLKSVSGAKWDWLWKKVYWVGDRIETREDLVECFKVLSPQEKQNVFDLLVSTDDVGNIKSVDEFISKLDKGELDTDVPGIENVLDRNSAEYQKWVWDNNKPTNLQRTFEIGKKGVENGTKVLTKTVELINPVTGVVVNTLSKVNQFCEYIEDQEKDNTILEQKIKANIHKNADKLGGKGGIVIADEVSKMISSAQSMMEMYSINFMEQQAVSKAQSFDWGGVNIFVDVANINPEMVIAELADEFSSTVGPAILLYTDMLKNEADEFIVSLPEGDWDLTTVDETGKADTIPNFPIMPAHFLSIPVFSEDESDPIEENESENIGINLTDYERVHAMLVYNPFDSQGFGHLSISNSCDDGVSPLGWNNNVFSVEFDCADNRYEYHSHHYKILGAITKSNDGELMASGEFIHIRTIDYSGINQADLVQTHTLKFDNIPFKAEISNQQQFEIRIDYNDAQAGMDILNYGSYSYVESGYRESSVVNVFQPLSSIWPTEYFYRITVTLTNGDD